MWKALPARTAEVLSRGRWQTAPHLEVLSNELARATFEGNARVIVSMPPRHGKSELTSHYFPAWFLDRYPDKNVMLASYSADLAEEWGRKVRNTILTNAGLLRVRISRDSRAAGRWHTDHGGEMTATGVGGPQTGRGAHMLVIDDPVKNEKEAYSEAVRESIWSWYTSAARTRLEPNGSIVLVMTRWHEDDLAGRLLRQAAKGEGEQWTEIRFPAIAEGDDVLGRVEGQALWAARYDEKALAAIRSVSELVWSALFQQQPQPPGTRMFDPKMWRHFAFPPAHSWFDRVIESWDCAFKDTSSSSFVVGQLWGIKGARAYLLDQVRRQMSFSDTCKTMLDLRPHWVTSAKYVEAKANGPAILDALHLLIPGMIGVEPRGGKEARAAAIQPFVAAGNVWLPRPEHAPWVHEFVEEARLFPQAPHDDQVDALSQALDQVWLTAPTSAKDVQLGVDHRDSAWLWAR